RAGVGPPHLQTGDRPPAGAAVGAGAPGPGDPDAAVVVRDLVDDAALLIDEPGVEDRDVLQDAVPDGSLHDRLLDAAVPPDAGPRGGQRGDLGRAGQRDECGARPEAPGCLRRVGAGCHERRLGRPGNRALEIYPQREGPDGRVFRYPQSTARAPPRLTRHWA